MKQNPVCPTPKTKLLLQHIINQLKSFPMPECDYVVGIAEGGTVPAALVAAKLRVGMSTMKLSFRGADNAPVRARPRCIRRPAIPRGVKKIIIVDDVSVTGASLAEAKIVLKGYTVKTLVFKGEADYVLFPEIKDCVAWPWNQD